MSVAPPGRDVTGGPYLSASVNFSAIVDPAFVPVFTLGQFFTGAANPENLYTTQYPHTADPEFPAASFPATVTFLSPTVEVLTVFERTFGYVGAVSSTSFA